MSYITLASHRCQIDESLVSIPALCGDGVTREIGTLLVDIKDMSSAIHGGRIEEVSNTTLAGWGAISGPAVNLQCYAADGYASGPIVSVPTDVWAALKDFFARK